MIVCVALLIAAPLIARLFDDPHAVLPIRLMAVVPFISSLASPRLADLIRELNFSRLALIGIGTVVVELGVFDRARARARRTGHHRGQDRGRHDAEHREVMPWRRTGRASACATPPAGI